MRNLNPDGSCSCQAYDVSHRGHLMLLFLGLQPYMVAWHTLQKVTPPNLSLSHDCFSPGEIIVNSFAVQANEQPLLVGLSSFVVAEIPQDCFLCFYINLAKRTNFCLAELTRKADPLDQLPQSQPKYHQSGEPYSDQHLQWHCLILIQIEENGFHVLGQTRLVHVIFFVSAAFRC